MTERFAQYDPTAWIEDDVLVIRAARRSVGAKSVRSLSPMKSTWKSTLALSCVGLAFGAALRLTSASSGGEEEVVVSRHETAQVNRAGPERDAVPTGYWKALGRMVDAMPVLPEDDDVDSDDEPFI